MLYSYLKFWTNTNKGAASWLDDTFPLKLKTHQSFVLMRFSSLGSLLGQGVVTSHSKVTLELTFDRKL